MARKEVHRLNVEVKDQLLVQSVEETKLELQSQLLVTRYHKRILIFYHKFAVTQLNITVTYNLQSES